MVNFAMNTAEEEFAMMTMMLEVLLVSEVRKRG